MLVTAGGGTTSMTASRNQESTLIASHASGASVYQILTNQGLLNAIREESSQSIAYAASITPDVSAGSVIIVGTLTGNITVNAPTNPLGVQHITFLFTQDATGGHTITWNAIFKTAWQPASAANAISSVSFFYDGTNWQQLVPVSIDQNGNARILGTLTVANGGTITTGGLTVSAGGVSVTGSPDITMTDAVSRIVPGATSFAVRDTTNANDNLLVSDAGVVTARSGLVVSGGGSAVTGNSSFANTLTLSKDLKRSSQSISFSATITPDATAGELVIVGALTGNLTVGAPTNPATGQFLTFLFTQDVTGNRTVTWNAAFKTAFQPANTASAVSSVTFFYDGTNWQDITGVTIDNSGNLEVHSAASFKLFNSTNASWAAMGFDGTQVNLSWPFQTAAGQFLGSGAGVRPGTAAGAVQTGNLFMGSGAPSNTNGNNGDFYFRTDTPGTVNQRLYVKSAGSWTGIL